MIELYAMGSPNVVKVFVALEELELEYRVKPVDVFRGEQFKPGFSELSPAAKVPVIIDSDGPSGTPYKVFESGAILIYLAEKAGKFLPLEGEAKFDALQWLMVQVSAQGPMSGQVVHFTRFAPEGNDYAFARYRTQVHLVYQTLENRLATSPYLAGDSYTIADIAMFPWTRHDVFRDDVDARYPHVAAWSAKIGERPAVRRAMQAVERVKNEVATFVDVSDAELDRFLARGVHGIE